MTGFALIKLCSSFPQNVANAPFILTAVLGTVKTIPTEIIQGIKDAVAGKPSAATPASPKSPAAKAA